MRQRKEKGRQFVAPQTVDRVIALPRTEECAAAGVDGGESGEAVVRPAAAAGVVHVGVDGESPKCAEMETRLAADGLVVDERTHGLRACARNGAIKRRGHDGEGQVGADEQVFGVLSVGDADDGAVQSGVDFALDDAGGEVGARAEDESLGLHERDDPQRDNRLRDAAVHAGGH